jgi:hypothetical protein
LTNPEKGKRVDIVSRPIPKRTPSKYLNKTHESVRNNQENLSNRLAVVASNDDEKVKHVPRSVNTNSGMTTLLNTDVTGDPVVVDSLSNGMSGELPTTPTRNNTPPRAEGVNSPSLNNGSAEKPLSPEVMHTKDEAECTAAMSSQSSRLDDIEDKDQQYRSDIDHPLRSLEHKQYTLEVAGFRQMAPFIRFPNGETYLHPPLPPGWHVSMCKERNKPYYWHPDFGRTYFPPIHLPSSDGFVRGFTPQFIVSTQGQIPPPYGDDVELDNGYDEKDLNLPDETVEEVSGMENDEQVSPVSEPKEEEIEKTSVSATFEESNGYPAEIEVVNTLSKHKDDLDVWEQPSNNNMPGDSKSNDTSPPSDDGSAKSSTHDEVISDSAMKYDAVVEALLSLSEHDEEDMDDHPLGTNDSPPGTSESPHGVNDSPMFVLVPNEHEPSVAGSLASCISYRAMHPPLPLCSLQNL